MNKALKFTGMGCSTIFGLIVTVFLIIGSIGPDPAVYTGRQIPKSFMKTIRSLNLLEEEEQIRYFYSDALLDIKDGFYFVTDKNLVLYSTSWEEPETIIPFDQIASIDAEYNDSIWEDTYVSVTTFSGMDIYFPVSSERGLDKRFVGAIQEKMNVQKDISADVENSRL